MENLCLKIMNKNMEALAVARGENEVNLVYTGKCNLQDPLRRPPDQPVSESICWEEASAVSKAGQRIRDTVLPESGSKCM